MANDENYHGPGSRAMTLLGPQQFLWEVVFVRFPGVLLARHVAPLNSWFAELVRMELYKRLKACMDFFLPLVEKYQTDKWDYNAIKPVNMVAEAWRLYNRVSQPVDRLFLHTVRVELSCYFKALLMPQYNRPPPCLHTGKNEAHDSYYYKRYKTDVNVGPNDCTCHEHVQYTRWLFLKHVLQQEWKEHKDCSGWAIQSSPEGCAFIDHLCTSYRLMDLLLFAGVDPSKHEAEIDFEFAITPATMYSPLLDMIEYAGYLPCNNASISVILKILQETPVRHHTLDFFRCLYKLHAGYMDSHFAPDLDRERKTLRLWVNRLRGEFYTLGYGEYPNSVVVPIRVRIATHSGGIYYPLPIGPEDLKMENIAMLRARDLARYMWQRLEPYNIDMGPGDSGLSFEAYLIHDSAAKEHLKKNNKETDRGMLSRLLYM